MKYNVDFQLPKDIELNLSKKIRKTKVYQNA